ncbi:MAG: phytanoyl-CoA dioxygenase family protein [Gammaproteobacteria bacterium]|nr:phytanoyl-CoA dioxygenase family protein [Gammaproteobacteria bacterium]
MAKKAEDVYRDALETDQAAEFFAQQGYYLAPGVFPEDVLQGLEEDFDLIVAGLTGSGEAVNARWSGEDVDALDGGASTIVHTHNVQRYSSRWLQALQHERFLGVAEKLLGPDIVLHHTKLFMKPPREGSPFPIHQDWWYFPTAHDSMLAAIIFLTDADADAGGLCIYPGSHRLGRLPDSSGLEPSDTLRPYPLEQATPVGAKRGDVLFFSYLTLHGSPPNRSDRCRKTVLVQLHSGSDYVLDNDEVNHVNEALVLRGWNHHMTRERAKR